jgi:MFS family permease
MQSGASHRPGKFMRESDRAGVSPSESGASSAAFSPGYRRWLLFVILLLNALNMADRQGLAVIAPAIKRDLMLSDTQLGLLIGLGFAIFFALVALPIARLAEHKSRTKIIAAAVAVFGIVIALCGTARVFWQFFLFRIGVGVGDAGFGPPVASLIADHYPLQKRASAMAAIWFGAPIGSVVGAIASGWLAQNWGWRWWFFALSVPALVLALVCFFTLREPPRGMSDPVASSAQAPPAISKVLRFLWSKQSFRQILIGAGLGAIAMNGLGSFLARYLVAMFSMGFAQAGLIIGSLSAIAMTCALVLGGIGLDRAAKSDRRWYVWGPAISLLAATPLLIAGVAQTTVMFSVIVLLFGEIALFVYWTPTLAMAQNMVGANMRASSAFVVSIVLNLFGAGLGAPLAGSLSDAFAQVSFGARDFAMQCPGGLALPQAGLAAAHACLSASAAGVQHAIMAISLLLAWGGIHYLLAARKLRTDLDTHYRG